MLYKIKTKLPLYLEQKEKKESEKVREIVEREGHHIVTGKQIGRAHV